MQRIAIANIEVTQGEKDGRQWKKTTITGEDGAKASTFDMGAANLSIGEVIDAEFEIKGKFTNIKSFHKVGNPAAFSPAPAQPAQKPQQQAQGNRDDIIAEQVAFKGVIDLLCAKVIDMSHPWAGDVSDFIDAHLSAKYDSHGIRPHATHKSTFTAKAKEILHAEPVSDEIVEHFENVGALFTKASLDGISRTAILQKFNIKEKEVARINPDDLWPQVYSDMIVPARKLAEGMDK